MVKQLKISTLYFEDVLQGAKRSEIRFNDRNYQVGDIYRFNEYDGIRCTGRYVCICITHVLEGFEGLQSGWCMFSFVILRVNDYLI